MSHGSQCVNIFVDFFILFIGYLTIILHRNFGNSITLKRGYFCDDDSIRYPYKSQTISSNFVNIYNPLACIIVICLNEYLKTLKREHSSTKYTVFSCSIPESVINVYHYIGILFFGICVTQITVNVAKINIGRLRPFFLDVCKPNIDCTSLKDPHSYVTNYTCSGWDTDLIASARLSFPSGHSSISAFCMVYLVLYLQSCMAGKLSRLQKPFLQFLFLMFAWYIALTRYADNMHHWEDILTGLIIGSLSAILVAFFVTDMFTKHDEEYSKIGEGEYTKIDSNSPSAQSNSDLSSSSKYNAESSSPTKFRCDSPITSTTLRNSTDSSTTLKYNEEPPPPKKKVNFFALPKNDSKNMGKEKK